MPRYRPKYISNHLPLKIKILLFFFLLLFLVSCGMFLYSLQKAQSEKMKLEALAQRVEETSVSYGVNETPMVKEPNISQPTEPTELVILEKYRELYEQNTDMAGWIQIEGTEINYPVMLTPDDEEYYLHRDFEQEYAYSGLPFIGKDTTLNSNNIIIYGHNMKNKTMFSSLLHYAEKDYWKEHPVIRFDTIYEEQEYEVVGVFYSKAYYSDETDVFRYYSYRGDLSEQEYTEYMSQVYDASLYRTDVAPHYGEQLITLSTCSYHVSNGRFVVVAKKK